MNLLLSHPVEMIAAPTFFIALAILIVVGAAIYDVITFTIPNAISIILALLFVLAGILIPLSVPEWGWQFLSGFIAFAIGFILFALNIMGGGDVKLYGAIGLWVPPLHLLKLTLLVTTSGLIITIGVLIFKMIKLKREAVAGLTWVSCYKKVRRDRIAYGPAIAMGTLVFYMLASH